MRKGFDLDTEKRFKQSKQFTDPLYIRGIFLLFILLYALFGFLDMVYFPEMLNTLIVIRFVIVIPILSLVVALTFTKHFYKLNQIVISFGFFIGGIGIAHMLILEPGNIVYNGGLFMVLFSGFLLCKIRFIYASIAGWCIFLFLVIGHLILHRQISTSFFYSLLFFAGAIVIGMAGSYNIEKMNRKQFLHSIRINQFNESLKLQYEEKNNQLERLQKSIKENEILQKINIEKDILTKSLQESEEQYKLLATQMHMGLALHEMIYDDQGNPIDYRFISVNDSFERLTGLDKNKLIGKTVLEVIPETEKYWIETYGEVAKTGKAIQFENYAKALGKYYSLSAYSPKKGLFAVIVDDITNRKKLEEEQIQREKDLLTSQKIAHLGTWRLVLDSNDVVWSEELYKMYGFDPTLPPPPYSEHMKLFTKPSWEKLSNALSLTSTQGIPYELELETVNTDGSNGWMWVRGEAEKDENGIIKSISGAAQDITQRKQLEQELSISNQKFIAIFEKSPVAIEFYDAYGRHDYANDAANELFGVLNPAELKGLKLFENPNLDPELVKKIENFENIQIEIEYDFEKVKQNKLYQTTKSGKRMLKISITPLIKENQLNGYILHSEDITLERQKQKEIEYLSYHDYLTNLYNRRYFVRSYHRMVSNNSFPLGIMMIDINGLKIINDAYGHTQGDITIKLVSKLFMKVFDKEDVVARIGGDEFAVLAPGKNAQQMQAYKEKITELVKEISVGNIEISLAIGYDVVMDSDKDIDELLSTAENYLYRHKVTVGTSIRNHAIKAILNTLTDKYHEEKLHSERVSTFCKMIGTELGISKEEVDLLELAGMYHDIGKISIPDAILNKPGKLTYEEFEIIKTHTQAGYQILKAADEYSGLAEYALSHHERWDGKGYPKGLKETEIPLFSRIINVADSFEAMTADRPYRKGMSVEEAIAEIKRCSGSQFDPHIAMIFVEQVLTK
ncbi:MAG: diguanylate cyclase [Firmicutes bacterium]|nr:diguanylate cyclase [Bacillota bacterium]